MSLEHVQRFTCEACGKVVLVTGSELALPKSGAASRGTAMTPKGWLAIHGAVRDECAQRRVELDSVGEPSAHVCSATCAVQFLNAFISKCESVFAGGAS